MRISVFGLGYVGSVSAVCLAELGHEIVGTDIAPQKVNALNKGIAPVKEPQLEELLQKNLDAKRLIFTLNSDEAIQKSDCAMIAVGTPSDEKGAVNLSAVERCVESIAATLSNSSKKDFTIIIRSTVPPGTTKKMQTIAENISNGKCKIWFSMNPEFLREGSAVSDFFNPALIVFGAEEEALKDKLKEVYQNIEAKTAWIDTKTAELVKYTNNAFHAMKVAFANEIGRLSEAHGADGSKIMELLCADTKLNISTKYLRPGFAFGGSCLPKDLRGVGAIADKKAVRIPLLNSIIESNNSHIEKYVQQILEAAPEKISVLGMVFKTGTDDVRESAGLRLTQKLINQGIAVKMTDINLTHIKLMGANRRYIDSLVPDWQNLYTESVEELFNFSDTIIMTTNEPIYKEWLEKYGKNKQIINLF